MSAAHRLLALQVLPGLRRRLPGLSLRKVNLGDRVFHALATLAAAGMVVLLGAMAVQLARAAALSIQHFGWSFLAQRAWDPVRESFGALPFVYGTVVSSVLALLLAVPVALGTAVFLSELAPRWVRQPLGLVVELLAAIPSVVYGLWGIFVLAPWLRETIEPALSASLGWTPLFQGTPRGVGMLAGALVLAIMVLPTVTALSRDVMQAVPAVYREGALALGATRWESVRMAVLPVARSGILGAVVLGLGRAVGETMAVTMVIGNRAQLSTSLFDPAYTMASVMANEYAEATGELHLAALAEIGLLLFLVTVGMNLAARALVRP